MVHIVPAATNPGQCGSKWDPLNKNNGDHLRSDKWFSLAVVKGGALLVRLNKTIQTKVVLKLERFSAAY